MIDEADNGRRLAEAVGREVARRITGVTVTYWPATDEMHWTSAVFTSPHPADIDLEFHALFDWSFRVWFGSVVVIDEDPMRLGESEHVSYIVTTICDLARTGLAHSWLSRLRGRGDYKVLPWRAQVDLS